VDGPGTKGTGGGVGGGPARPRPAAPPDLSIIVVNYRSAPLTVRALEEAARSADGLEVEELVLDAGSTPQELALLREQRPQAQVIELGANRGFAAANNAGIARARGRHLLLVNPDAFAQGDAVQALVRHLDARPAVGLVAPLLCNEDGSPQDNAHRRFPNLLTLFVDFCAPVAFLVRGGPLDPHHVPRSALRAPRPIAHATGAALLVRAAAAAAAGPLDEGYFLYLEETEWQRRLAAAGWGREVVPSARFTHLGGGSSGGFALASPHYLASVRRYYPHPRAALAVVWVAAGISLVSLRAALALGRGSPRTRELAAGFSAVLGQLPRACRGRARRTPPT
jgi:N-acetylglucosaminyl-diphospho-decaprenol L-rhamnosyltransferase